MKSKVIISVIILALFICIGGYNVNTSQQKDLKDDLLSLNIKAFASTPSESEGIPSSLGCKKGPGRCYIFDGDGTLVDKVRRHLPY